MSAANLRHGLLGLVLLFGITLGASLCAAHPAAGSAQPPSSPESPPFRALRQAGERFTASSLTMRYDTDLALFLNPRDRRIDLDDLDLHGRFPYGDTPEDSTAKALYERAKRGEVAEVTPPEKAEIAPPQPGVHTGIPSAAAATGALIGGLAILIKILTLGI
jgi:hypothetical protein